MKTAVAESNWWSADCHAAHKGHERCSPAACAAAVDDCMSGLHFVFAMCATPLRQMSQLIGCMAQLSQLAHT